MILPIPRIPTSAEVFADPRYGLGSVYFIACDRFIKIGFSKDPARRMAVLQPGSPHPMRLLSTIRDARLSDEQHLHKRFAHLAVGREWFRAEPELLEFIASIGGGTTQ